MASTVRQLIVRTPDGRSLDVLVAGHPGSVPVVFHHGTPGGPVPFLPLIEAAEAAGLSLVTYGRPGYGRSDSQPGRAVVDASGDVQAIVDHLEIAEFVTLGWSGGGPHTLACGARLPGRCLKAATIASVAPFRADGLQWMQDMAADNIEEYTLARQGIDALEPALRSLAGPMRAITATDLLGALDGLLAPADRRALTGRFADWLAASVKAAVAVGIDGWRDDDLAFVKPWGFGVASVACPVSLWHGVDDQMVPVAHGRWLVEHLTEARGSYREGHGHLSLAATHLDAILADLAAL